MNTHWYGLLLVGAAHVCACTNVASEPLSAAREPLLAAPTSTRSDVVAVQATRGLEEQLCTGTLLLPNLVLTARHCLIVDRSAIDSGDCSTAVIAEPDEQTRVTVIPGTDVDLIPEDARASVTEYLLADNEGRLCGEDIALLLLDRRIDATPISVSASVPGVDVPLASTAPPTAASATGAEPSASAAARFTAIGYGLFDGDWGQQRQRTDARLLCNGTDCADERLAGNELLANAGACEGDSGGPAIDGDGRQFALLSRSTADCSESAYLALGGYVDWMTAGVRYAADKGEYELPTWLTPAAGEEGEPAVSGSSDHRDLRAGGGGCSFSCTSSLPRASLFALFVAMALLSWRLGLMGKRPQTLAVDVCGAR